MKSLLLSALVTAMLVGCTSSSIEKHHASSSIAAPAIPVPDNPYRNDPTGNAEQDRKHQVMSAYDRLISPAGRDANQANTTDKKIVLLIQPQNPVVSQFSHYKNSSQSLLLDDFSTNLSGVIGEVSAHAKNPTVFGTSQAQSIKNLMLSSGATVNTLNEGLSPGAMGLVYNVAFDLSFQDNTRIHDLREMLVKQLDDKVHLVYPRFFHINRTADKKFRLIASFISANGKGYMSVNLVPISHYTEAQARYPDLFNGTSLIFLP